MAATKENPIIFYDIPAAGGSWSPNSYKTRATLNYKGIPYRVQFVSYPDIEPTLKALGAPPGSPVAPIYTLPVIADPSSDPNGKPTFVSESFQIALYLEDKYPAPKYPTIFPPGTRAMQEITSTYFVQEAGNSVRPITIPLVARVGFLDERSHEYFNRTRTNKLKEYAILAKSESKLWGEIHDKWEDFGNKLDFNNGPDEQGPFVMGKQMSFTDFTIGGIIHWLRRVDDAEGMPRWKNMAQWQGGRWARLWAEFEKLEKNSPEVV